MAAGGEPPRHSSAPRGHSRAATPDSAASTAQFNELDAYAALVERLQAEVQRERSERELSVHRLATLRASYRLLLQRCSDCADAEAEAAPGAGAQGAPSPHQI